MQSETEQETIQSSSWDLILSNLHDFSFQKIGGKKDQDKSRQEWASKAHVKRETISQEKLP